MKIFYFIAAVLLSVNFSYSQDLTKKELDSLYNKLTHIRSPETRTKTLQSVSGKINYVKCGLELVNAIKMNLNRFTPQQQLELKKLLQRPSLQTSTVTPSGNFRIHYDTSGYNAPTYSIHDLAIAADSAYNFEVNYLGYPPAPPDGGLGGDNKYDIYVLRLSGEYGETDIENSIGNNKYTTFQMINNDFSDPSFYTKGINAARVTVAHEYFHGIQIGNYINRISVDAFFYELSSTAMEDFVYNSINDYYAYLPSYFNNTQNAFGCSSCDLGLQEYALAIWNIFLRDRFEINDIKRGYDILKRQWELMPQMRALEAINNSILEYGSTYRREFNEFGIWLFYTNYRARNGQYFREAANYPLLNISNIIENIPSTSINGSASPTSENYLRFIQKTANNNFDTLDVIISNSDYRNGIDSLYAQFPYRLSISYNPASLSNNYDVTLVSNNSSVWSNTVILDNNIIIRDTTNPLPPIVSLDYAYPNPFFYSLNNHMEIPTGVNNYQKVDLNVYSVSMKLVYSERDYASPGKKGSYILRWNGLDSNGEKLPSGVYVYYTKNGSNTTSGKIVIFNK